MSSFRPSANHFLLLNKSLFSCLVWGTFWLLIELSVLEAGLHNSVWDLYSSGLEGKWSFRHTRYHFHKYVITKQSAETSESKVLQEEGGPCIIYPGPPRVLCLGWSELSSLIGHTFLSPRAFTAPCKRGGGGACASTHTHDWPRIIQFYSIISAGSRSRSRVINTTTSPGNENEHRPPTETSPAPASWSLWEGCCSKLLKCPSAGAPSPWSNGWRGGSRARQPAQRRRWGPWTTCPDRRSPASPGTCSPNGGCHGCTSYR